MKVQLSNMAELKQHYTQEFMISKTDQRDDSKYVSNYYYHSQTLSKSVFNEPILNLDKYDYYNECINYTLTLDDFLEFC